MQFEFKVPDIKIDAEQQDKVIVPETVNLIWPTGETEGTVTETRWDDEGSLYLTVAVIEPRLGLPQMISLPVEE